MRKLSKPLTDHDRAKITRYSQSAFSQQAWFDAANRLEQAMTLLEPGVRHYWNCLRDNLNDPNGQNVPEYGLENVHLMLAGLVIENLCKGHLVAELRPHERSRDWEKLKGGRLPESLKSHAVLALVKETGMKVSDPESYLLKRIEAIIDWRGRYPIPTSHQKQNPFMNMGSDIDRSKEIVRKLRVQVGAKTTYRVV
ncbi:MAG: hypothetical protein M3O72_05915 [Verrucomicrobiota bacterium]|nr:hypothetical protein [Verrucomicrobiota bacterium]